MRNLLLFLHSIFGKGKHLKVRDAHKSALFVCDNLYMLSLCLAGPQWHTKGIKIQSFPCKEKPNKKELMLPFALLLHY